MKLQFQKINDFRTPFLCAISPLFLLFLMKNTHKTLSKRQKMGVPLTKSMEIIFFQKHTQEKEKLFNAPATWLSTNLNHTNVWGPLPQVCKTHLSVWYRFMLNLPLGVWNNFSKKSHTIFAPKLSFLLRERKKKLPQKFGQVFTYGARIKGYW